MIYLFVCFVWLLNFVLGGSLQGQRVEARGWGKRGIRIHDMKSTKKSIELRRVFFCIILFLIALRQSLSLNLVLAVLSKLVVLQWALGICLFLRLHMLGPQKQICMAGFLIGSCGFEPRSSSLQSTWSYSLGHLPLPSPSIALNSTAFFFF